MLKRPLSLVRPPYWAPVTDCDNTTWALPTPEPSEVTLPVTVPLS